MEFGSYELVSQNTASLNTGSYVNKSEYSLFVNEFTSDIWYGISSNDVVELSIWDRNGTYVDWNVLYDSKSYNTTTLSYLNETNTPVTYSYVELNQDLILYKNSGALLDPVNNLSSSFGILSGSYYLNYNFVRNVAGSHKFPLIIKEISPSRKEIKLIPINNDNESILFYNAFCNKQVILSDVSPLYLTLTKYCEYEKIYSSIKSIYETEIVTLKNLFFLNSDGEVLTFLKNLYEDLYIYSSDDVTYNTYRIQGIKTYFTNYLLSNSNTSVSFKDIDNKFNFFVTTCIEYKFSPLGSQIEQKYIDVKKFIYDYFTKYYYNLISSKLAESYIEKYFSYLKNGLNFGDGRILPILQHSVIDERLNTFDPLTLIIKLKSELPIDIATNTSCWISNISLSPYVISAIINYKNQISSYKIGPPNFNLNDSVVSLTNTNKKYTYENLQNSYEDDQNITISKKLSELNIDYTNFENFILFSSAELRLKIFKNKIINLSSLNNSLSALIGKNQNFISSSGVYYPYYAEEYKTLQSNIKQIIDSFDGYECYLYNSGLYQYVSGSFTNSNDILDLDTTAKEYDKNNRDSLINNCPSYILNDSNNDDYIIFLSMIGHYFDHIYEYISSIPSEKTIGHSSTEEFTRRIVDYILQTFGWNLDDSFEQNTLLENYLSIEDVQILNNLSSEERLKIIRNRILINLPQIYKTKGTEESIKLILACYGIPSTLLSIREYGGPNNVNNIASYTTYERSYMYQFHTSSKYEIFYNRLTPNAKTYLSKICLDDGSIYENNHHMAIMGAVVGGSSAIISNPSGSGKWAMGFVKRESPNMGEIWFRMGYYDNPSFIMYSGEFPLFDGNVYSIMIRKNSPSQEFDDTGDILNMPCSYDLFVKRNEFGKNIIAKSASYVSYDASVNTRFSYGPSDTYLVRGNWFREYNLNRGFHGAFDKIQIWYDELSNDTFEDYVNSINSFSFSGSKATHESLLFRSHTDYPFDLRMLPPQSEIPILVNLIDWGGIWTNANPYYATGSIDKQNNALGISDANNMDYQIVLGPWSGSQTIIKDENGCLISQSCYPYQFKVIDYPSTIPTSQYGPNKFRNEKIKTLEQSVETRFDVFNKSTYTNPDSISSDSIQLGVFVDPQDFKNKDIIRYYGNLNLMDNIGNPMNQYTSEYDSLKILRNKYIKSRNEYSGSLTLFNELMTIYKIYFNRSIFESIKNVVPARSNTLTGIVIEPTILERPKYQFKQINSEVNSGSVSYSEVNLKKYVGDNSSNISKLSMIHELNVTSSINISYTSLPTKEYPINYNGNYISDVMDMYSLGHFADID